MPHIVYAPVDRQFGCLERDLPSGAPFNGIDPLPGIRFGFALASRYPLAPGEPDIRYATVEGEVANDPAILLRVISQEEYKAAEVAEMAATVPAAPLASEVDAERDRRISASVSFDGNSFQSRATDRENIAGAAQLAFMAIIAGGKKPGDLRWHDGASDFAWISADNGLIPMDAPTVIAFAKHVAAHKSAHIFAARALKDMAEIPADFADDKYWP